jgi:hypothetical protein
MSVHLHFHLLFSIVLIDVRNSTELKATGKIPGIKKAYQTVLIYNIIYQSFQFVISSLFALNYRLTEFL